MPTFRATVVTLLFLLQMAATSTSCQSVSESSQSQNVPKQAPLPHLYWHLLMWQNHLDKSAAEHEQQGENGSWLRGHLQKQLGFTESEFAPIRESAQRLASTLADLES